MSSSSSSSSSSFSLPSAGGVVSLLNDERSNSARSAQEGRKTQKDGKMQPGGWSAVRRQSDGRHQRYTSRFDDHSASTSESVTPGASPFDTNPSSGSGGESAGTSMTSLQPSGDNASSRDGSFNSQDKLVTVRDSSDTLSSEEGQQNQEEKLDAGYKDAKRMHIRVGTSSSSSQSEDGDETEGQKRRRLSDSRADETVQSQGRDMKRMLSQQRLARSPPPMNGQRRDNEDGKTQTTSRDDASQGRHDVPMNMHRATGRTHGGFRGKNELDEEDGMENTSPTEEHRGADSSSAERERSSVGSSTAGRKATNGSQMIDGKKRYPCSFPGCDKTFSTSGHAARHNRIHTGSKPYRCTFPGCNASFSRQDNSLQHYRTHVLHPKSRSGNAVSLDGGHVDALAIDSDLANLDPDTIATVQMGRKALEEGTAIAVVQEFIDGNGRRAEAVQRMVGQPKSDRRGSNATQGSPPQSWREVPPGMQSAHHRRSSFAEPYGYRPWSSQGPPGNMPPYYSEANSSMQSRHHYDAPHPYSDGQEPYLSQAPSHPSYAPPGHHYGHESARHVQHPTQPIDARSGAGYSDEEYYARQPYAPSSSTHADYYIAQRNAQVAEEYAYHERMRRSSEAGMRAPRLKHHVPHHQPPPSRTMGASPEFATPAYQTSAAYSSRQSDDGRSGGYSGAQHRRSLSAAQGHYRAYAPGAALHDGQVRYKDPWARTSRHEPASPPLSVRSFRSEGQHEPSIRDGRDGALALLSDTAMQKGDGFVSNPSSRGPTHTQSKSYGTVPPAPHRGFDKSYAPASLPPPTALSKLPYSSDRSTNILTPPVTSSASQQPQYPHIIH